MNTIKPNIESSWLNVLAEEFRQPYFQTIKSFLIKARDEGRVVYPRGSEIFNAFNTTPFHQIKAVILGQDPYHGAGQAHGLCFSVKKGIKPPPSLQNIFKEIHDDVGITTPSHGNLTAWAKQGVLLLNAILTVQAGQPASHSRIGWEIFTDAVIQKISQQKKGVVFLLWGKFAQQKITLIDQTRHPALLAPHPSPFSANRGFFGCKHFSTTNNLLKQQGKTPIDWSL